jgi:hypothetical protein
MRNLIDNISLIDNLIVIDNSSLDGVKRLITLFMGRLLVYIGET